MIIKIKPLSWFQKHAFMDEDDDFWATAKLRDSYNNKDTKLLYKRASPICITKETADTLLKNVDPTGYNKVAWAVSTVVTKREYPEYFI